MSTPPKPFITQFWIDRVVQRAQNSHMGLNDPEQGKTYNLSNYEPTAEGAAMLLIGAHVAKYDLVSLMAAVIQEMIEPLEEARRRDQKWMDGIKECCGTDISFEITNSLHQPPTLDQFIRALKKQRDEHQIEAQQANDYIRRIGVLLKCADGDDTPINRIESLLSDVQRLSNPAASRALYADDVTELLERIEDSLPDVNRHFLKVVREHVEEIMTENETPSED